MLIPTQAWKTAETNVRINGTNSFGSHQEKSNNAVLILLPFLLFKMDKVELSAYSKMNKNY